MNTQNLDYLKNGLKYTGFDTVLNADLVKKIAEGQPEFQLEIKADYGQNLMEYNLHFRKGDQNDMYFYNKYEATLRPSSENQKEKTQTFYINKNRGITAKRFALGERHRTDADAWRRFPADQRPSDWIASRPGCSYRCQEALVCLA